MKDLNDVMKHAQEMRNKMESVQAELANAELSGTAGGGMVTVILNGKNEMRGLTIDPSLVSADDVEILEDLIVAAFNDAKAKVERHTQEEMKKVAGGFQLPPGFKMPF